jgi:glycosyltransferase involved in cell wall biosynthesis
MKEPLVSCIMPTADRRGFIRGAVRCFLEQSYPATELVIVDTGNGSVRDIVSDKPEIRYFEYPAGMTVGRLRNLCCRLARGEIICHWDDDDWSARDRIADQVARLQSTGAPVTGYNSMAFWDEVHQSVRWFSAGFPGYVLGTSLCYWKTFWQMSPFGNRMPEDLEFIRPVLNRVAVSGEHNHMVGRIHAMHQTSSKQNLKRTVSRNVLPAAFWENQQLRTL